MSDASGTKVLGICGSLRRDSFNRIVMQALPGLAPEGMQIKDPKLAGIFNMGGAAVANYVSLLEPAK